MGANHIRVARGLDGVELVAIVDPNGVDPDRAPGVPVVSAVEYLADVDYVVVASPTGTHEAVATHLVDRGIHVLIEKPLAATSAGAQRIRAAAERNGVVAGVGHIERFNPALREARRRIQAGELGRVFQVATERLSQRPARITDVGVGMDLMSHDVDLAAWLCSSTYASIDAQVRCLPGSASEDLIAAVGVLEDGTVVNHLVNWVSPFKRRAVVITGERGAFVVDTLREDLALHSNADDEHVWERLANMHGARVGDVVHFAFPKPEPLVVEHEVFRDAVLGQQGQIVTLAEGAATVGVVERVLGSLAT
jgi:predicted dehydrogenase